MTTTVKRRGGTTTEHKTFTGASREITIDTDKKTVVVHDGKTKGGFPLAREDLSNVKRVCLFFGLYEENNRLKLDTEDGDFSAEKYPVWIINNSDMSFELGTDGHLIARI